MTAKTKESERALLIKDLPKLLLLVALYMLQGLSLGFFLMGFPVVFKKYLSYSELGVIMMCTMPFSFKLLWSPLVEFYHLRSLGGKRKSWVIPTQLVMFLMLYYMKDHFEQMLIDKQIEYITIILTAIVFVITCQDIAVDAWAIEMLHKDISEYGSSCQTVGQRIGFFISGTIFISMTSGEFCHKWFGVEEPLWNISNFLACYCWFLLGVTAYVAFFVTETNESNSSGNDGEDDEIKEADLTIGMTLAIFKDVLRNKQVQTLMAFLLVTRTSYSIFQHVGEVYLTNDLGYDKANLSSIKVLITPLNIFLTAQVGYLARANPFGNMFVLAVIYILVSSWAVLGMLGTFPSRPED
jgi:hypothetical protein